jgi:hypothetical protein
MQAYHASQGKDPNSKWTEQDAIAAFHQLFRPANSCGSSWWFITPIDP